MLLVFHVHVSCVQHVGTRVHFFYSFIWLHQVLIGAQGIFILSWEVFPLYCMNILVVMRSLSSCGMWAYLSCCMWDLSSPIKDQTHILCTCKEELLHCTTRNPWTHLFSILLCICLGMEFLGHMVTFLATVVQRLLYHLIFPLTVYESSSFSIFLSFV